MNSISSGTGRLDPGRVMKIYFCDICNESIPLKDINSNRITIEEGKIFCQKCAPKKAKSRDRVGGPVLALLMLLVVGGAMLALYGWKVSADLRETLDVQGSQLSTVEERVQQVVAKQGTQLEGKIAELGKRFSDMEGSTQTALAEVRRQLGALDLREAEHHRTQMEALETRLAEMSKKLESPMTELRTGLQDLRVDVKGLEVEIAGLKGKIKFLEDLVSSRIPQAPPGGDVVPAPPIKTPSGPDAGTPPAADREINVLLAQLSDSEAGKRYSAVVELAEYGGDKVVKAFEGMLGDSEAFVRVAVVQNLRKLGSKASVPHILVMLRDADYFVRVAASSALTAITGHELGFDPDASPKDRETKAKEWEKWWDTNKDRVLRSK